MTAAFIVNIRIADPVRNEGVKKMTIPTVEPQGGKYSARRIKGNKKPRHQTAISNTTVIEVLGYAYIMAMNC